MFSYSDVIGFQSSMTTCLQRLLLLDKKQQSTSRLQKSLLFFTIVKKKLLKKLVYSTSVHQMDPNKKQPPYEVQVYDQYDSLFKDCGHFNKFLVKNYHSKVVVKAGVVWIILLWILSSHLCL